MRLATSEVIGVTVLASVFAELRERPPGLKLELVVSNQPQGLLRCDADLAQLALARSEPVLERVLADQFAGPLETWVAMHEDCRPTGA